MGAPDLQSEEERAALYTAKTTNMVMDAFLKALEKPAPPRLRGLGNAITAANPDLCEAGEEILCSMLASLNDRYEFKDDLAEEMAEIRRLGDQLFAALMKADEKVAGS